MKGWKMVSVLLVLLFTASTSFAGGFRLPEQGAKAMGMGFAFTAQADDPSAIYFNPAGLTQLQGQNVMVGVTYVRLNGGEFTGTTPVDNVFASKSETQKSLDLFIPNAYYTKTTSDGYLAYGVGIFAPFGLGQEYENIHSSIFRNQITKIDLQTVVVNPTIAFKVNEFLSIGLGIDWMYGKATLEKTPWNPALIPVGQNGNVFDLKLDGDGDAWGYNFGLLLKPSPNFRIGASYRSPFTLDIKGADVTLSNINPGVLAALAGLTSTKGKATIELPATFALGAAYTMGKLTVEADADWTFWHSYGSLPIDIKDNRPVVLPDSNAPKNWHDVVALRIGTEYRVTAPLALRAGFVYDPSPVPASTMGPELPDADKLDYMVGVGYKIGAWTIDVAGMYVDKKDRTVNNQNNATLTGFNGTWTGDSWLAGLDVGYNF
ncbi:OmpP1/FadL family transporter [Candidatus Deferrimicrobium sp.]|uniref:OmpP1/FadL family transporter n=1 Tax=Candidatus Deferrimicrobium sp. TaxID=3060586 RepID=UPI003C4EA272